MLSRLIIIPLKANQQKHIFTFLHYTFVKICRFVSLLAFCPHSSYFSLSSFLSPPPPVSKDGLQTLLQTVSPPAVGLALQLSPCQARPAWFKDPGTAGGEVCLARLED